MRLGYIERLLAGGETRFHPSQEQKQPWVSGGYNTNAGATVTHETAMAITGFYACIRILAETLAMLPLQFYQKEGSRRRSAEDFYLDPILSDEPNPEMTGFEFRETLMGHLAGWGNAFAEIDWDGAGRVRGLWPLPPDRISLRRERGQLIYRMRFTQPDPEGNTYKDWQAYRIWHLRGLGPNGLVGYSPVALFRQSLGLSQAAEEYGARFFGNGARPGFVLTHPGVLDGPVHDRLKTSWTDTHQGLSNAHRVAILEEGMSVQTIGVPPEDAQFLETRKFQLSEIARIFRIQPHKIGDLEHATFSNIEHMAIEFLTDTMLPWLVRWEASTKRALLLPEERRAGFYPKFNAEGLLRGDTLSRYQAYAVARQWGWLSANDIRAKEEEEPFDGGDVYMMPLNMVPVNSSTGTSSPEPDQRTRTAAAALSSAPISSPALGAGPAEPENREQALDQAPGRLLRAKEAARNRSRISKRYEGLFEETLARIMRRERNDILGQARKQLRSTRTQSEFLNWLEDFYREHEDFVFNQMNPLAASFGETIRDAIEDEIGQLGEVEFDRFLRSFVGSFARRYSRKQLSDLLQFIERTLGEETSDKLEAAIEAELERWVEERPSDYAQNEANRANNAIAKHLYITAGILTLRWAQIGDSCPYCTRLDGAETQVTGWFLEPGEFQPDGADRPLTITRNIGHPPAHKGCDCMIVAGIN